MIERLRMLPTPLRLLVYAAGAALLFLVALGLGATAAVVLDWRSGQAQSVTPETTSAETSSAESASLETTSERSIMEATGIDDALERAGIKPSKDSGSRKDVAKKAPFIHRASDGNSRGDYTYISETRLNGNPDAIVLVSPTSFQKKLKSDSYPHNIGVWYESQKQKWAIFNQDLAAVPEGATFNVAVPRKSKRFVHKANRSNTAGSYTYLDDPLTNGKPGAVVSITQNWNPGGGSGVYNNHPVGAMYDAEVQGWAIYNLDGASMPEGAAFNVTVSTISNANLN